MRTLNQRGALPILIAAGVVLVAVIAFVIVMLTRGSDVKQSIASTNVSACKVTTDDGNENGELQPLGTAYTFCVPNGWNLAADPEKTFYIGGSELAYNEAVAPKISEAASDGPFTFTIGEVDASSVDMSKYKTDFQPLITPDAKNGAHINGFVHTIGKEDPIGAGIDYLEQGTKHYEYIIKTSSTKAVTVTYNQGPNEATKIGMVNAVVSGVTLK